MKGIKALKAHFMKTGILVGRFQTDTLHEGHKQVIDHVLKIVDHMIIFVGVAKKINTRQNPLSPKMVGQMLKSNYQDQRIKIAFIHDRGCDKEWSHDLDGIISINSLPGSEITLYGGRDSFISRYYGKHKTVELPINVAVSGTRRREFLSLTLNNSAEFRHGVIWAVLNRQEGLIDA